MMLMTTSSIIVWLLFGSERHDLIICVTGITVRPSLKGRTE
jgi:hypothetical protein